MYKIEILMWHYGNPTYERDELEPIFDDPREAMIEILSRAIDEVNYFNSPNEGGDRGRYYSVDLEGGDGFDAVVRCWDGDDYDNVTAYNIIMVEA